MQKSDNTGKLASEDEEILLMRIAEGEGAGNNNRAAGMGDGGERN